VRSKPDPTHANRHKQTSSPLGKQAGLMTLLYFSLAERNLGLGEILFKRT
jgi:hypothetical protein